MSMRNIQKIRFPKVSPKRRDIWELMSDFLREASVLVLVFGLLDAHKSGQSAVGWYDILVVGISAGTFLAGFICEGLRK